MLKILMILLALTSCITSGPAKDQATALQYRWEQGKTYRFRQTTEQKTRQIIKDKTEASDRTVIVEYSLKAESVAADGTAQFNVTYEAIKLMETSPKGQFQYDSSTGVAPAEPAAKIYAAMAGKNFHARIAASGEVKDVIGTEAMLSDVTTAIGKLEEPVRQALKLTLQTQFGVDALKETLGTITILLPTNPVKVGDTWETKDASVLGFPQIVSGQWTLENRDSSEATMQLVGQVTSDPGAEVDWGTVRLSYDYKGTKKAKLVVDWAKGALVSSDVSESCVGASKGRFSEAREQVSWPLSFVTHVMTKSL